MDKGYLERQAARYASAAYHGTLGKGNLEQRKALALAATLRYVYPVGPTVIQRIEMNEIMQAKWAATLSYFGKR